MLDRPSATHALLVFLLRRCADIENAASRPDARARAHAIGHEHSRADDASWPDPVIAAITSVPFSSAWVAQDAQASFAGLLIPAMIRCKQT
jgi:hypothetical protein